MAPGNSGPAKNTCAGSTTAAAHIRDCRKKACRCFHASRYCLPKVGDRSSCAHVAKLNSRRFVPAASSSGPVHCAPNRRLEARGHGLWCCLALPKCVNCCLHAARNYFPQSHSWAGSSPNAPMVAGSGQSRAGARSFRNLPQNSKGHSQRDPRTGRSFSCCYAHRLRCLLSRSLRRSSCARILARLPVRELFAP